MEHAENTSSAAQFERIYRETLPSVHRFARTRIGMDEAEDLAAEVFHAAAVAFSDGRRHHVTPAWIMAVARNKVIDHWRKAERRSAITLRNLPRAGDLSDFPPDWTSDPRRENVLDALDALKTGHRTVLVLHYLDGMPSSALAKALGCSVSSIESRLARARKAFRTHYRSDVTQ